MPQNDLKYPPKLRTLFFYILIGLTLFFLAAVAVFSLRSWDPQELTMPELTGKYYVNIHNELSRIGLRVTLVQKDHPERNPGIILHQSIPAGSRIRPHQKLYLTINQPQPILKVPNLVGLSLSAARSALLRIPHQGSAHPLEIGAIHRIAEDDTSPNTILAQFPPADEIVPIWQKVYLLISISGKPPTEIKIEELKDRHVLLLSEYFLRLRRDYRLRTLKPGHFKQNGVVYNADRDRNGTPHLDVYYQPPTARHAAGYEKIETRLIHEGECEAEQISENGMREVIFQSRRHEPGEKITILFYRRGKVQINLNCGGSLIYTGRFRPDNFG